MPSVKLSKKGKVLNPIANKILITNTNVIEVALDKPEIVTEKKSILYCYLGRVLREKCL